MSKAKKQAKQPKQANPQVKRLLRDDILDMVVARLTADYTNYALASFASEFLQLQVKVNSHGVFEVEGCKKCQRCGSRLLDGFCSDETCLFYDHIQSCNEGWLGHPHYLYAEGCTCHQRIIGLLVFQQNDARGKYITDTDNYRKFDATEEVLAMDKKAALEIEDDTTRSDDFVSGDVLGNHNGPYRVEIAESIRKYFLEKQVEEDYQEQVTNNVPMEDRLTRDQIRASLESTY